MESHRANRALNLPKKTGRASPGRGCTAPAGVAPLLPFLFVTLAQLTSLSAARLPLLTPFLACCAPCLTSLLACCAPLLSPLRAGCAPFLAPLRAGCAPFLAPLRAGLRSRLWSSGLRGSGLLCYLLGCLLGCRLHGLRVHRLGSLSI